MTLEERLHQGSRAKEVLENEAFIEAFESIEKELIEAWKTSPIRDAAGRESIHQHLTALHKIRQALVTTLETGKLAAKELTHKESLKDRALRMVGR